MAPTFRSNLTFRYQLLDSVRRFQPTTSHEFLEDLASWPKFVTTVIKVVAHRDTHNDMRWIKPSLRSSIYGLLGGAVTPSESTLESSTEDIREAMLSLLGDAGPQFPHVTRRIRYANDLQGLWYLRGDLMAALASLHGEALARKKMQSITHMFQGLLPGGMTSRPSPLG